MKIIDNLNRYIDTHDLEIHIYKNYIHIINYDNIISFSEKEIKIDKINVIGSNLIISKLNKDELCITGSIYEVILK